MKKFFLAIFIFTAVFFTSASFNNYAYGSPGREVKDPARIAETINTLIEWSKLFITSGEELTADIKGIMGKYGLGALSPIMDKILENGGIKDLISDEVGGIIGAGGFLEGALQGIFRESDTVSMILKQFGVIVPPKIYEGLKDLGIFNSAGILQQSTGSGSDCGMVDMDSLGKISTVIKSRGYDIDDITLDSLISKCVIDPQQALLYYINAPGPTSVIGPPPEPPCQREIGGKCLRSPSSINQGDNSSLDLNTDPAQLVLRLTTLILGIAGGIALLMIIIAGFKITMSKGNPQTLQTSREQIIASMAGLIFILLSYVIFQLIVVDILKIPGICNQANDPNCAVPDWDNPARKVIQQNEKSKQAPVIEKGEACIKQCMAKYEQVNLQCNRESDRKCEEIQNSYTKFDSGKCYREGIIACGKITDSTERTQCNTNVQNNCREKAAADKPPSKSDCVRDGIIACNKNIPNCNEQCK